MRRSRQSRARGSPPRVRSRPHPRHRRQRSRRITSACAEQTPPIASSSRCCEDHLRVCGADTTCRVTSPTLMGSPPRVRSRPKQSQCQCQHVGITSACAEQTSNLSSPRSATRDHLRVCGADQVTVVPLPGIGGSPPRVRSRPFALPLHAAALGITSACAEQTRPCG